MTKREDEPRPARRNDDSGGNLPTRARFVDRRPDVIEKHCRNRARPASPPRRDFQLCNPRNDALRDLCRYLPYDHVARRGRSPRSYAPAIMPHTHHRDCRPSWCSAAKADSYICGHLRPVFAGTLNYVPSSARRGQTASPWARVSLHVLDGPAVHCRHTLSTATPTPGH